MAWRRRSIFLVLGAFAACTDPYSGDEAAPAPDRSTTDAGGPEIGAPDGEPPVDANGGKPGIDASCSPCDCDQDGFHPADAAACADAGSGPADCDDLDPRAHPDAGFLTDQPTPDTRGDWNCNGKVERQYGVNVQCADFSFSYVLCIAAEGFVDDPACGATAKYVKCSYTTMGCTADITEMRTQGCR